MPLSSLLQTYMETVFQLCISITLMMFSLSVLNVITDSILTKSVPSSDSGEPPPHRHMLHGKAAKHGCEAVPALRTGGRSVAAEISPSRRYAESCQ